MADSVPFKQNTISDEEKVINSGTVGQLNDVYFSTNYLHECRRYNLT